MNEFDLIKQYFDWGIDSQAIALGVGDDCAIVSPSPNTQLLSSVDTLIEGVHFTKDTSAKDIAYKALAVNLSDLAAMGATPKWFTLALTLPNFDPQWLGDFSTSLKQLADEFGISLIGGDTTKGTLSISINVMGEVKTGKALLRCSAQAGDIIFVSNTIGDGAYAWQQIQQHNQPSAFYVNRLNRPAPRVLLGQQLLGIANGCIDVSDGLEQDLSHILQSSNVGASIAVADIPLSVEVNTYVQKTQDWCLVLAGGDDYELCFTVPKTYINAVKSIEKSLGIALTQIGVVTQESGLTIEGWHGQCQSYRHF